MGLAEKGDRTRLRTVRRAHNRVPRARCRLNLVAGLYGLNERTRRLFASITLISLTHTHCDSCQSRRVQLVSRQTQCYNTPITDSRAVLSWRRSERRVQSPDSLSVDEKLSSSLGTTSSTGSAAKRDGDGASVHSAGLLSSINRLSREPQGLSRATLDSVPSSSVLRAAQESLVGDAVLFKSPLGSRRLIYADWTASSRVSSLVEGTLARRAHPLFGNTHTESSAVGIATTHLREAARETIKKAVRGAGDEDVKVIFTGTGTTGAINKLIAMLGIARRTDATTAWSPAVDMDTDRPIVFVGPYEHHSNELAWREAEVDYVVIPDDELGRVDVAALDAALTQHASRKLKIGSFSGASNVTGALTDIAAVSATLRRHGALRCFDCAALAPHAQLDMRIADALFISPHKLIGGPGTPGVLVIRRSIVPHNASSPALPPSLAGGGTVAFVTAVDHAYLDDIVAREEAGTPDILGSIRAGLVFDLQRHVGYDLIAQREHAFVHACLSAWRAEPSIVILGNSTVDRAATVSFLIGAPANAGRSGRGERLMIHHNLVVAMLSDLFGVQARSGCSCAGPYGARLLSMSRSQQKELNRLLIEHGAEGIKPGWTRVSLSYTDSPDKIQCIIDAVIFVARNAASLIKLYRFELESARFVFAGKQATSSVMAPSEASWPSADELFSQTHKRCDQDKRSLKRSFDAYMREAQKLVQHTGPYVPSTATLTRACELERWFILP